MKFTSPKPRCRVHPQGVTQRSSYFLVDDPDVRGAVALRVAGPALRHTNLPAFVQIGNEAAQQR